MAYKKRYTICSIRPDGSVVRAPYIQGSTRVFDTVEEAEGMLQRVMGGIASRGIRLWF